MGGALGLDAIALNVMQQVGYFSFGNIIYEHGDLLQTQVTE
jgi:hypothetical protein